MTLKELSEQYITKLKSHHDKEEALAIFRLVIDHYLHYNYTQYLANQTTTLDLQDESELLAVLQKLEGGEPIQYILGEAAFYGLKFNVNSSVLIPRPETEELVQLVIDHSISNTEALTIVDIGTGSGCIAIALKKNLPEAAIYATDIAVDSLALAESNASLNNVELKFIEHDILSDVPLEKHRFDVIVSNPPYITEDEKLAMHHHVLAHEPHRALFVSNEEPLLFYKAIVDFAVHHLNKNGVLFFEINEHLGQETLEMIQNSGFGNVVLFKDMQGKDRMIKAMI